MIGIDKPQKTIEDYLKVTRFRDRDDSHFTTLMRYNVLVEIKEGHRILKVMNERRFDYIIFSGSPKDILYILESHDYKNKYFIELEKLNKEFIEEVILCYTKGYGMLYQEKIYTDKLTSMEVEHLIRKEDIDLFWNKMQEYYK